MGMYTALSLGVEFKKGTPGPVIRTIRQMMGQQIPFEAWPEGALFRCGRAQWMLRCDSYYFDYQTHFSFEKDGISKSWYLSGVCNLKNYNDEIELFLKWILPHLETTGFIGWKMYEEDDEPTLLFRRWHEALGCFALQELTSISTLYSDGFIAGQVDMREQIRKLI